MANRQEYEISCRIMDGTKVTGYGVTNVSKGGKPSKLDVAATAYLVGRGQIRNAKAQIYKDDLLFSGVGCELSKLPSYKDPDAAKAREKAAQAQAQAQTTTPKAKEETKAPAKPASKTSNWIELRDGAVGAPNDWNTKLASIIKSDKVAQVFDKAGVTFKDVIATEYSSVIASVAPGSISDGKIKVKWYPRITLLYKGTANPVFALDLKAMLIDNPIVYDFVADDSVAIRRFNISKDVLKESNGKMYLNTSNLLKIMAKACTDLLSKMAGVQAIAARDLENFKNAYTKAINDLNTSVHAELRCTDLRYKTQALQTIGSSSKDYAAMYIQATIKSDSKTGGDIAITTTTMASNRHVTVYSVKVQGGTSSKASSPFTDNVDTRADIIKDCYLKSLKAKVNNDAIAKKDGIIEIWTYEDKDKHKGEEPWQNKLYDFLASEQTVQKLQSGGLTIKDSYVEMAALICGVDLYPKDDNRKLSFWEIRYGEDSHLDYKTKEIVTKNRLTAKFNEALYPLIDGLDRHRLHNATHGKVDIGKNAIHNEPSGRTYLDLNAMLNTLIAEVGQGMKKIRVAQKINGDNFSKNYNLMKTMAMGLSQEEGKNIVLQDAYNVSDLDDAIENNMNDFRLEESTFRFAIADPGKSGKQFMKITSVISSKNPGTEKLTAFAVFGTDRDTDMESEVCNIEVTDSTDPYSLVEFICKAYEKADKLVFKGDVAV